MLAQGTIEAFRLQAEFCGKFGSPLYEELLGRAAADIERRGPVARILDGWTGNPIPDALVLRLMGAVHHRVLTGAAPELARYYPSVGGTPAWPATGDAFLHLVDSEAASLRPALDRHVQTNEIRRSASLGAGFLTIAAAHGLPLSMFEIGSSAGLNLCWDRYRYEMTEYGVEGGPPRPVWGNPASPVLVRTGWEGPLDVFANDATVVARAGCDLSPVDVCDPEQVRVLESFIWADQLERLAQLRAAVALTRQDPPALTRQHAGDWLAEQLAIPRAGVVTVIFHSIMWWYLSEEERERVTETIKAAGSRATSNAPLAWLNLELKGASDPDLRLTQWPGGGEIVLAHADPHGRYVRWRS
jgi:hypothetical protein